LRTRHECLTMPRMDDLALLEKVVAELKRREWQMRKVAAGSGIPYDTVLRIKNGEGDPSYGKVERLARYLFDEPIPAQQQ
jgi:transcriptional regulator with XRE-family HTH domain